MHNWIEGILQHHARCKWGIGIVSSLKANQDGAEDPEEPHAVQQIQQQGDHDDDINMLDAEILDLHTESQEFGDFPLHPKQACSMTASMYSDSASELDISEDSNSDDDDIFQALGSDSDSDDSLSNNGSDKQK